MEKDINESQLRCVNVEDITEVTSTGEWRYNLCLITNIGFFLGFKLIEAKLKR